MLGRPELDHTRIYTVLAGANPLSVMNGFKIPVLESSLQEQPPAPEGACVNDPGVPVYTAMEIFGEVTS